MVFQNSEGVRLKTVLKECVDFLRDQALWGSVKGRWIHGMRPSGGMGFSVTELADSKIKLTLFPGVGVPERMSAMRNGRF